jgi:hypothetical protein
LPRLTTAEDAERSPERVAAGPDVCCISRR